MCAGSPGYLETSAYRRFNEYAKPLIRLIVEGFRYHPFFVMLKNSIYSDDPVYPFAHQLELLAKLFARRPIRVLVGDDVGLGKTVSAIMLLRYLLEVDGIERTLILVPRVLMHQWLSELNRFNLGNKVLQLERETILAYKSGSFPPGIYIASIDLVKKKDYSEVITKIEWDLVVVDEAHRIGKHGKRTDLMDKEHETQRFKLVQELVRNHDTHVILLTATPHRGKAKDYIERLKLVDPYISADWRDLDKERFYRLFLGSIIFRRTKLDVNEIYERTKVFTNCKFKAKVVKASDEEEIFHNKLIEFLRAKLLQYYEIIGKEPRVLPLLMAIVAKRASSSPRAAITTLNRILQRRARELSGIHPQKLEEDKKLRKVARIIADAFFGYSFEDSGLYEDAVGERAYADELLDNFAEKLGTLLNDEDVKKLKELHDLASSILGEKDSRLNSLITTALKHLENGDKVVIFTEFRDTAEYLFKELRYKLPKEFANKTAMITGSEIRPPAGFESYYKKYSIEDIKKWLKTGDILVLVSTDVASEGLNLQAANVVIHYEPTWSPVKMVQRIGRVWRLGQKKDVVSYSLLLTIDSDMAALEVLYAKLLSWIVSGIERTVPIGEELEIDMLPKDRIACNLIQLPLPTKKGRPQYSELKAYIEFIVGGRDRLRRYIETIIAALARLKEQAERLGLNRIEKEKIEMFLNEGLGGLHGKEAEQVLVQLLELTANICGYEVEKRSTGIFIKDTNFAGLRNLTEIYGALESLLKESSRRVPTILIVNTPVDGDLENLRELRLYEVTIYLDKKPVYSEVVGVAFKDDNSTEIYRGRSLLELIPKLMREIVGICDGFSSERDFTNKVKISLQQTHINKMLGDFFKYLNEMERENLSSQHTKWSPRGVSEQISASSTLVGVIVSSGKKAQVTPLDDEEAIKNKAVEYVIEFEKKNQREPEKVSKRERYDVRSIDLRTGEVRFIKVVGCPALNISAELTEFEYNFGKDFGDRYWLYIVYGLFTGDPRLLMIRNPVDKAKWVAEAGKYRLAVV